MKYVMQDDISKHENSKGTYFKIMQISDMHYGESEEKDDKNDQLIIKLLQQEDPSLVLLTGDMVSGKVGEGQPGWFAKQHQRWSSLFSKEVNLKGDFKYMYTLGNNDQSFDLSKKQIVELDQANPNSQTDSMFGDSTNQYVLIKKEKNVLAALFLLETGGNDCYNAQGFCGPTLDASLWLHEQLAKITKVWPHLKVQIFFHIPPQEAITLQNSQKPQGTMNNQDIGCSALNTGIFTVARKFSKNVVGLFFGHDHNNDWEYQFKDILLSQGRKTGQGGQGPEGGKRGVKILRLYIGIKQQTQKYGPMKEMDINNDMDTQIVEEDLETIERAKYTELKTRKLAQCRGQMNKLDSLDDSKEIVDQN